MGVKGLWKLLDGTGRPVHLESLEGKVLAVDISVWLNMAVKGMRDYQGHSMANAHLITLFTRICKLLFYGIKPVFVFDGKAPLLKQKTLRERRERKDFNIKESKMAKEKVLQNFLKKQILESTLGKTPGKEGGKDEKGSEPSSSGNSSKRSFGKNEVKDIYELPPLNSNLVDADSENLEEEWRIHSDLHMEYFDQSSDVSGILSANVDSMDFNSLPSDVQYELLKDMKEIKKRRRTQLEAMPENSDSFSDYQIAGLLEKRKITKKMENVEQRMMEENVAASSVHAGIMEDNFKNYDIQASQLISDSSSHFIWMQNSKKLDEIEEENKESLDNEEEDNQQKGDTKRTQKEVLDGSVDENANEKINVGSKICSEMVGSDRKEQEKDKLRTVETIVTGEIISEATSSETRNKIKESVDLVSGVKHGESNIKDNIKHEAAKETGRISAFVEKKEEVLEQCRDSSDKINEAAEAEINEIETHNSDQITDVSTSSLPVKENELPSSLKQIKDTNLKSGDSTLSLYPEENLAPQKEENSHVKVMDVSVQQDVGNLVEDKSALGSKSPPPSECEDEEDSFIEVEEVSVQRGQDEEELAPNEGENLQHLTEAKYQEKEVDIVDEDGAPADLTSEETESEDIEKQAPNPWAQLRSDDVESFASQLDAESRELRKMAQAKERASRDVSESAQLECQELLQLFGLPYLVSPQEAEAQCAALECLGLTNGTITEDSDIWLFGGKYVIKSMFDSKNDPISFDLGDIEMDLGLNRDRFICIALCTGSDYTCGIDGVGPVKAMEIIKDFNVKGISELREFKNWWKSVSSDVKVARPKETKIKSQLRKVNLKDDFPSEVVYNAYLTPVVDETNSKFEWGFPDLDELRTYAVEVIGWSRQRVNEILLPLVKRLGQKRTNQTRITHFLPTPTRHLSKKKSKRVQNAAAVLLGKGEPPKPAKRKKVAKKVSPKKQVELNLSESSDED